MGKSGALGKLALIIVIWLERRPLDITKCWNSWRSRVKIKAESELTITVAARGVKVMRANSPKESPRVLVAT